MKGSLHTVGAKPRPIRPKIVVPEEPKRSIPSGNGAGVGGGVTGGSVGA